MNACWILKDSSGGGGGAILGQAMRRAGQPMIALLESTEVALVIALLESTELLELDGVPRGSAGGAFLGQGATTGGAL